MNNGPGTNKEIIEAVKPVVPGLIAFLIASILVRVYDSN